VNADGRLGYTPENVPQAGRRSRLRERGYADGLAGREKASTDPEYLTSYRRGRERRERRQT
jgi:copper oxidase (laccase) domain-containing protein